MASARSRAPAIISSSVRGIAGAEIITGRAMISAFSHASSIADILAAQSTTALTFAARFEPIAILIITGAKTGEVKLTEPSYRQQRRSVDFESAKPTEAITDRHEPSKRSSLTSAIAPSLIAIEV